MMPEWAPIDTAPMPPSTVRVNLPASEVCLHLAVAGRDHWVANHGEGMAQIYDDGGARYSAPILLSEAGLTTDGKPQTLREPTCCAVTFTPRNPTSTGGAWRLVVADAFDTATFALLVDPWLTGVPAVRPADLGLTPAGVAPDAEFVLNAHRDLGVAIERANEQPTAHITFAQLCARLARCWALPLPGEPELAIARAKIPFGAREGRDGAKHRLAAWPAADAAPMAAKLRNAGWIVHVVVERGHFALVARRRMVDIDDAIAALHALDAHGLVDLSDPTERWTLRSAELGASGYRYPPAGCPDRPSPT